MNTGFYELDPLTDDRWPQFVARHPRSSVFHSRPWLDSLKRTYGYTPVVYTTTPPGSELRNGLALCRVYSWLTGRRMVSLPFSDHCEPLVSDSQELQVLLTCLQSTAPREKLKYIELRPRAESEDYPAGFGEDSRYYQHTLNLSPNADALFKAFHKDSIQRKIRRAEREGLAYKHGRALPILREFYRLMILTRRRHSLPPSPYAWFQNLADSLGDGLTVHLASRDERAVAAILTLSFKNSVVYKYGCSDASFHHLGGMPFLFWRVIQNAKRDDALELDLGRTGKDNLGLQTFKERLGAIRSESTYLRFPLGSCKTTQTHWTTHMAHRLFSNMPDILLVTAGRLLYPHIG